MLLLRLQIGCTRVQRAVSDARPAGSSRSRPLNTPLTSVSQSSSDRDRSESDPDSESDVVECPVVVWVAPGSGRHSSERSPSSQRAERFVSVLSSRVVLGGKLGRAIVPVGTRALAAGDPSELPEAAYTAMPRPTGNAASAIVSRSRRRITCHATGRRLRLRSALGQRSAGGRGNTAVMRAPGPSRMLTWPPQRRANSATIASPSPVPGPASRPLTPR